MIFNIRTYLNIFAIIIFSIFGESFYGKILIDKVTIIEIITLVSVIVSSFFSYYFIKKLTKNLNDKSNFFKFYIYAFRKDFTNIPLYLFVLTVSFLIVSLVKYGQVNFICLLFGSAFIGYLFSVLIFNKKSNIHNQL